MGKLLVGLMVVWVVGLLGLDPALEIELEIEVEYHHFLVGGGGVVDRNGLGQPSRVLEEFDHIHLMIDSTDSIVRSHEASVLVGPDISSFLYHDVSRRVANQVKSYTHRIRSHPPPISHRWSNIITSSSLLLLLAENRKRFPRSIRRWRRDR